MPHDHWGRDALAFVGCSTRHAAERPSQSFKAARGKGISVFRFDDERAILEHLHDLAGIDNPHFCVVGGTPEAPMLYAASEVFGWNEGTVSAYRISAEPPFLHYLNKQPSGGSLTCYLSVEGRTNTLLAANYSHRVDDEIPGQAVVALPIRPDGSLAPAADAVKHRGSSTMVGRQDHPHPHCVVINPDAGFALAADLGLDKIFSYRLGEGPKLTLASTCSVPAATGPRHLVFHPDGERVYSSNELNATIGVFAYDAAGGRLDALGVVPAQSDATTEKARPSGIIVDRSG